MRASVLAILLVFAAANADAAPSTKGVPNAALVEAARNTPVKDIDYGQDRCDARTVEQWLTELTGPEAKSIAWTGRESSVSVACTHDCSCSARRGSASSSSSGPRMRASGRGTGASTNSQEVRPSRPSSTSQEPLRCVASEKEYASGDPL